MNTIQSNISAREEADQLIDLMVSIGSTIREQHGDAAAMRYFDCIRKFSNEPVAGDLTDDKMTDDEARAFGRQPVEFGKHKGTPLDEVPMDYLYWLDDQPDFRTELRRYLRSDRVAAEDAESEASDE